MVQVVTGLPRNSLRITKARTKRQLLADDEHALSAEQRFKQQATIAADRFATECEEESLVQVRGVKRPCSPKPDRIALPQLMRPEGPGYMPLFCAALWIATKGGVVDFDPVRTDQWEPAYSQLLARISIWSLLKAKLGVAVTMLLFGIFGDKHRHRFRIAEHQRIGRRRPGFTIESPRARADRIIDCWFLVCRAS